MDGTTVAHALSVAHGIGACLACLACFYAAGLLLLPRRLQASLGQAETPALIGATAYVIGCWLGIAVGITLTNLAIGFGCGVMLLAAARYRRVVDRLASPTFLAPARGWLLAFIFLYVLAYLFTLPPATSEYLPPAWNGNIDLLTYVRYSKHLLRLGPSNLTGFSYLDYVYLQTPAVFYLLGGLSLFFHLDPLSAAMPAQFGFTALTGIAIARVSQGIFGLSRRSGVTIAAMVVSGAFFRYVAGAYFLSTLMAMPVLLYLLWQTVASRASRHLDFDLAVRFGCAYVLLLFLYPFLLFTGITAQAAAIGLKLAADAQVVTGGEESGWVVAARNARRTASTALAALLLVTLCFFTRLKWSFDMVRSLSRKGIAGWPLDIISPLALFGVPGARVDHRFVVDAAGQVWIGAAFCVLAVVLLLLYFWLFRRRVSAAQQALVGLTAGSLIAYCVYFFRIGTSYQQWKFASYSVLPLSFVVFAAALHLLGKTKAFAPIAGVGRPRPAATALLAAVAAIVVGGNLAAHAWNDPVLMRFPGGLRNLAMLDRAPFFRELTVQMDDMDAFGSYLALYYLPTKKVHIVSSQFEPHEPLLLENISRLRPLLIRNYWCSGVAHGDTMQIEGVGCLLLAPPSLVLDRTYPFSETFMAIDFVGLSGREDYGRWNSRPTVSFKLLADIQRIWTLRDTYVNLRLRPYVTAGIPRQRMKIAWGTAARGETSLDATGWLSLPVKNDDWGGERVRALSLSIEFLDGAAPHWVGEGGGGYKEERPLAAVFEALSISLDPRGELVRRQESPSRAGGE